MEQLLEHNRITVEEVEYFIKNGEDCCVVNPCGSGKTYVMESIIENHNDKSFTIVTKQANANNYYKCKSDIFKNVKICTYNKVLNDFKTGNLEGYDTDFLFLDEAHYMGADKWFLALGCIKKRFNPITIGFTATPKRFDQQGTDSTIVNEYFNGNSAGNFTSESLQKKGLFIEPECIVAYYNLDSEIESRLVKLENSDMTDIQKEAIRWELERIKNSWEQDSSPKVVINNHIKDYMYKVNNNRILVYSSDLKILKDNINLIKFIIKDMFPNKKVGIYEYTYKSSRKVFDEFLKDNDDYIKILFSIDKIMETVHIDDLNIIFMMRPSISDRIIIQQYGRINNVKNKNKSLILDFVGNIDRLGSYSNLKDTRDILSSDKKNRFNVNFKYAVNYLGLFSKIDSQLKRFPVYTYKGLTGGISFFAKVYSIDKMELAGYLANGYNIKDAIECSSFIGFNLTDDMIYKNHPMKNKTNEVKPLTKDKILNLVSSFIARRKIKDEDMQQDLYLFAFSSTFSDTTSLMNGLNHKYTQWCKIDKVHNDLQISYNEESLNKYRKNLVIEEHRHRDCCVPDLYEYSALDSFTYDFVDDLLQRIEIKDVFDLVPKNRNIEILLDYYGLDRKQLSIMNLCRKYNLSSNRVYQIIHEKVRDIRRIWIRYNSKFTQIVEENIEEPKKVIKTKRRFTDDDISRIAGLIMYYKTLVYNEETCANLRKEYKELLDSINR